MTLAVACAMNSEQRAMTPRSTAHRYLRRSASIGPRSTRATLGPKNLVEYQLLRSHSARGAVAKLAGPSSRLGRGGRLGGLGQILVPYPLLLQAPVDGAGRNAEELSAKALVPTGVGQCCVND